MRRLARTAMVVVLAVPACSSEGDSEPDDAMSVPAPSSPSDEIERLDRQWERYAAHRARMATGDLVDVSSDPCDDTSDCPLGFDVDGWYYVLTATPLDGSVVGEAVTSLPDGSTAHAIVGVASAVYLVRVEGGRRELLVTAGPSVATTRERTLVLRADRCSIVGVAESIVGAIEFSGEPRGCDDPAVRWLVGYEPDRWDVDPAGLSDPNVWRTEPIDPLAGEITGPSGTLLGPFDDPVVRLDLALDRQCARFASGQCRVGYSIDDQSADRIAATFVRQNVAEGSDVAFETTYVRVVLDRLADAGWWSTELGPSAIHPNGLGATGFADTELRFDGCCDVVVGSITAP